MTRKRRDGAQPGVVWRLVLEGAPERGDVEARRPARQDAAGEIDAAARAGDQREVAGDATEPAGEERVRAKRLRIAAPGGRVDLGGVQRLPGDRGVQALEARAAEDGFRGDAPVRATQSLPDLEFLVVHRREVRMPAVARDHAPAAGARRTDRGAEAGARPEHDDRLAVDDVSAAQGCRASRRQERDRLGDRAKVVHEQDAREARGLRELRRLEEYARVREPDAAVREDRPRRTERRRDHRAAAHEALIFAATSGVVGVSSRPVSSNVPFACGEREASPRAAHVADEDHSSSARIARERYMTSTRAAAPRWDRGRRRGAPATGRRGGRPRR